MAWLMVSALASSAAAGPNHPPDTSVELFTKVIGQIAADDKSLAQRIKGEKDSMAVVFIPGILGSKLTSARDDVIWGQGIPSSAKLALERKLINPEEKSDVQASVLYDYLGVDFYGNAIKKLEDAVRIEGVTLETCGYDWRRDIRAGARDLQRCLTTKESLKGKKTLIFIAHSMGGLVNWAWQQQTYGDDQAKGADGTAPRVRAIILLGSPLEGSCEMLRMMQKGYEQPNENTLYRQGLAGYAEGKISDILRSSKTGFENALSRVFSKGLRRTVFTWPGAFELLPAIQPDPEENCVFLDPLGTNLVDNRPLDYFGIDFWNTPPGKDIMRLDSIPPTFNDVLSQARDFRRDFLRLKPLPFPVGVYRTSFWHTPTRIPLTPTGRLARGEWNTDKGDGRVTAASARALKICPSIMTWGRATTYAHGSIPNDDEFVEDFRRRLTGIVRAHIAVAAAAALRDRPELLDAYIERRGSLLTWGSFVAAFEGTYPAPESPYKGLCPPPPKASPSVDRAISNETLADKGIIDAFNTAVAARSGRPSGVPYAIPGTAQPVSYDGVSRIHKQAKHDGAMNQEAAGLFEVLAERRLEERDLALKDRAERIFSVGNMGLALAQARDYGAAVGPLTYAERNLGEIPSTYNKPNVEMFKRNVVANLGIVLFETGACKAAREFLRQAAEEFQRKATSNWFVDDRRARICKDAETGVLVPMRGP
jgi:pimeloyl-ACP methyl ester carboxylesterase